MCLKDVQGQWTFVKLKAAQAFLVDVANMHVKSRGGDCLSNRDF